MTKANWPQVREFIPGARAWESWTGSIDTRVTFNNLNSDKCRRSRVNLYKEKKEIVFHKPNPACTKMRQTNFTFKLFLHEKIWVFSTTQIISRVDNVVLWLPKSQYQFVVPACKVNVVFHKVRLLHFSHLKKIQQNIVIA